MHAGRTSWQRRSCLERSWQTQWHEFSAAARPAPALARRWHPVLTKSPKVHAHAGGVPRRGTTRPKRVGGRAGAVDALREREHGADAGDALAGALGVVLERGKGLSGAHGVGEGVARAARAGGRAGLRLKRRKLQPRVGRFASFVTASPAQVVRSGWAASLAPL